MGSIDDTSLSRGFRIDGLVFPTSGPHKITATAYIDGRGESNPSEVDVEAIAWSPQAVIPGVGTSDGPSLAGFSQDNLYAAWKGGVAKVVESCGGVVSGSLQRASPALARRWRPRHGAE